MSTLTKEWLQKTIAELEEERDATPGAVNEDAAMALAAMKLALASLEAEPVYQVFSFKRWRDVSEEVFEAEKKDGCQVRVLYTAPPAPVSVPAAMEMDDDFDSAFEHGKAVGWNACRAAMLQSFGNSEQLNSPVIPDGWVAVPVEPTAEMLQSGISAHYERSQMQIHDRPAPGPMECAYAAMLAAAPQQEDL